MTKFVVVDVDDNGKSVGIFGPFHSRREADEWKEKTLEQALGFVELAPGLSQSDISFIFAFWKKYHLKDVKTVPKKSLERIASIFESLPEYPPASMLKPAWGR